MIRMSLLPLTLVTALLMAGCPGGGPPLPDYSGHPYLQGVCGDLGYLPDDPSLSEEENLGRCAWYLYTAGGEEMFRNFSKATLGKFDLLRTLDTRKRGQRFEDLGLINDPGCRAATEPDEFGLWLDECDDPLSSGVLGMRKIPNPHYKAKLWDAEKYAKNPVLIEPPYRIGLTCGICHLGFAPTNPPSDPASPEWDNVDSMVGNQYFSEPAALYGGLVTEEDFEWHVLASQARGTSDPTRLANDMVNNPNAIRSVTHVKGRRTFAEEMNDGTVEDTLHLFIDGSDYAVETASLRVYLNIGMCNKYWITRHIPLINGTPQKVFDFDTAAEKCDEWTIAQGHAAKLATFLASQNPDYHLASAPGGEAYLSNDPEVLDRGKRVFAENCAWCHSSKQPPSEYGEYDPETAIPWFREAVMRDDFLDDNLLGNELRYPAIEIGTNLARAMNNNSARGHIYDQFSSATYKDQPSGGSTELYNPFDLDNPIPFEFPQGQGYYKPFPLYGVWAFAPFLHNNSLGEYTGDPSVEGRMKAFDDAVEKLLWPEKRDGADAIFRTSVDSKPVLPGRGWVDVPAGTPTVLLANLDWVKLNLDKDTILARLEGESFEEIVPLLLEHNHIPDFIPDKGHTYGAELADEDKSALIEYMKWM